MEDRYLFRGKRIDTGEWIVGSLLVDKQQDIDTGEQIEITGIYPSEYKDFAKKIDSSTICQCTGLKDKNGKLIWENDIVKFEDCGEEGYEYKEGFDFENKARVEFTEGRWSLTDFLSDNSIVIDGMYDYEEFMDLWGECEVIGNMIDNPELLEV